MSLGIHALVIILAVSFVAVTVIRKEDQQFEPAMVSHPRLPLRKLQVPVIQKKKKIEKPRLRQRIVVNKPFHTPEIKLPEITGVKAGKGRADESIGFGASIGFTMPEINFFGAKGTGEKVVFIVHFGPATIGNTPYERMTGYAIRKRLEDYINALPGVTLFNVVAYWMRDTVAISPKMMLATAGNKQKVMEWMAPVNPLEGEYKHCFIWSHSSDRIRAARENYPAKVTDLPFYSPAWVYPYEVPDAINRKYLGMEKEFVHWNRAVVWALQTQQPDAIFILTTNYIDAWGSGKKGNPAKIADAFEQMMGDIYGDDEKKWPTLNVVVLKHVKHDPIQVLNQQFGNIIYSFHGDGSIINDITRYMTDEEQALYRNYKSGYSPGDR
jgi:hypothetical protein